MRETKTITVKDTTIEVTQFGAKRGVAVLALLTSIVGPTLAALTIKNLDTAISTLATLNPDKIVALAEAFAECSKVVRTGQLANGKAVEVKTDMAKEWDDLFAGDMKSLGEWILFAAKVNFADFNFAGLAGAKLAREETA